MPMTPLLPGASIYLGKADENDPNSAIEAFLVQPTPPGLEDLEWTELGNSFGAEPKNFLWMIYSFAQFHNLQVQNESGYEREEGDGIQDQG